MKKITLFSIGLFIVFIACEKFESSTDADIFYHIQAEDTELPVWIKGNTNSNNFLVFINGGPGLTSLDIAKADMLGWGESFEKSFAMVYYDQRGTGNAQGNIDINSINIDQYLIDLKWVVQSIKAQFPEANIFLMGHSFGGFIGQSFLLNQDYEDLITGWINVNGSTIIDVDKEWLYRLQFLEELAQEKLAEDPDKWNEALEWVGNNNPIVSKEQKNEWRNFIGHAGDGIIPEENTNISTGDILSIAFTSSYNIFPSYLSSNLNVVAETLFNDVDGTDLLSELHKIEIPVLTLWGKYDDIIPPQLGMEAFEILGTAIENKTFVLFSASGHQPFINEPDSFDANVIDFITKY